MSDTGPTPWSWRRRLAVVAGVVGMIVALLVVIPAIDDLEPGLSLGQIAACFLYGLGAVTVLAAIAWDERGSMPSDPLAQVRWWLGR